MNAHVPQPTLEPTHSHSRSERGIALLLTSMCLLLISLLSINAIRNSDEESTAGARSRSTARSLHAADAGFQLALARLTQSPPNLNPFDVDLVQGANVQSRTRSDTSPQVLTQTGTSTPGEGFGINVDSGVQNVRRVYLVTVTSAAGGSSAELEAKLSRDSADATGY